MDFTGILVQLAYVAIFVGIAYFAVDQYRLWRERRVEAWRKDGHLPKPKGAAESGTNGKGELSTAAKYAIWNYMFSLFAVGGTIPCSSAMRLATSSTAPLPPIKCP